MATEGSIYTDSKDITTSQSDYDHFNSFIFSSERNIIYKLFARFRLYNLIKHLHGDIVECGVFKGSGLASWLKMITMDAPHDIRKVIGFDFYDSSFTNELSGVDKTYMEQVFDRCPEVNNDVSTSAITQKLLDMGISPNKFELVKGNVSITSANYIKEKPGFRISLLYMDLDIEEPTYDALVNFWDHIVPGGIIVFDEYAYHVWSEANAVDKFIKEKDLFLYKLDIRAPTAYIIKP